MPGMLPVLNGECVPAGGADGHGAGGADQPVVAIRPQELLYADLPQGYQISQLYHPIVGEGEIEIEVGDATKRVGIERIHLEQDAGKLIHDQLPGQSLVDLTVAASR
jgi:aspartyl-tRNA(Asn)/glutamyl-tRNA(Gln) amidotransferase subunit B